LNSENIAMYYNPAQQRSGKIHAQVADFGLSKKTLSA
jgi:hypothetical protein